jgi:hypothetical protein
MTWMSSQGSQRVLMMPRVRIPSTWTKVPDRPRAYVHQQYAATARPSPSSRPHPGVDSGTDNIPTTPGRNSTSVTTVVMRAR